jgi:PEP-CTERM motif
MIIAIYSGAYSKGVQTMPKIGSAVAFAAMLAGAVGLSTNADAALCPVALLPGQLDGVCLTDGTNLVIGLAALEPPTQEFFTSTGAINTPSGFIPGIVQLFEPNSGVPGVFSDALALKVNATNISAIDSFFISDGADMATMIAYAAFIVLPGGSTLPTLATIPETGGWQDVSSIFGVVSPAGFFVQSNVDVPEPTSVALLGFALIGLAAIWRRKRA